MLDRLFAGEKTQFGAMEARLEQFVDSSLESVGAFENADGFADHATLLPFGHFLTHLQN